MPSPLKIAITVSETRYANYAGWLKSGGDSIEIIELNWETFDLDQLRDTLKSCDGVVLTGGVDIHPRFYNQKRTEYPNRPAEWNEQRDEFELHVFRTAKELGLPVLAICRGLQLVNVALGGDLIQDLEESHKQDHLRNGDSDGRHAVQIIPHSLLERLAETEMGEVNSAHHQAAGRVSDELTIAALSDDGVVEALEWRSAAKPNWLLCVQWHPERMVNRESSPLSHRLRSAFLEVCAGTSVTLGTAL